MVNSEERKRLDDFFGPETSAELIAFSEEKNIPVYNVCPYEEKTETICRSGLWFRFYKPGSQLKIVIFKDTDQSYLAVYLKGRFSSNNPTKHVFDIPSLIDFVLTEAG